MDNPRLVMFVIYLIAGFLLVRMIDWKVFGIMAGLVAAGYFVFASMSDWTPGEVFGLVKAIVSIAFMLGAILFGGTYLHAIGTYLHERRRRAEEKKKQNRRQELADWVMKGR